MQWNTTKVIVTGGAGFLGRAVCAALSKRTCHSIIVPRRIEYDLTNRDDVKRLYDNFTPDLVLHLAAEVGGIGANRAHPGRFFYQNMSMGLNVIEEGRRQGIKKIVTVGTVCSYPKNGHIPLLEDELWNGYPEETNAPYGIAKRALVAMLDAYHREYGMACAIVVPVNLYGPGDNFNIHTSHVIPALIKRFADAATAGASTVTCWGSGEATREFLYVDDAAEGVLLAAERIDTPVPINLGTGVEITIAHLAAKIAALCGFLGCIQWDVAMPDGQPRRCVDASRAKALLEWAPCITLSEGLRRTVDWFYDSMPRK